MAIAPHNINKPPKIAGMNNVGLGPFFTPSATETGVPTPADASPKLTTANKTNKTPNNIACFGILILRFPIL
jgi:hypothetical protein